MFNFGELKEKVAVLSQRSGDPDYLTKIGVWLQMSHRLLSEVYDYYIDLQDTFNFTTADGQEDYPLPNRFDKPFRLYDLTNDKKLTIKTEEEYFDGNITNISGAATGLPDNVRIYGTSGCTTPIATTGDTVKVKSSSSSDTAGAIVRVKGYIDSACLIEDGENIIISTGTPTTFVAGTKTFYKITQISKSANTTGYITIANSTETTLEILAPTDRIARHKVLKLGLIPGDAYSMRLLFKKSIVEMVSDYDYPFTECDRYLIADATGWAFKQDKDDTRAESYWGAAKEAMRIILANNNNKLGPDYVKKVLNVWTNAHRNR